MGGQADSQVGSQVHASRKSKISHTVYRWLVINLCRLTLGGQTVKNLRRLAYEFELEQNKRKSSKIHISQRNQIAKWNASRKCAFSYVVFVWPGLDRAAERNGSYYKARFLYYKVFFLRKADSKIFLAHLKLTYEKPAFSWQILILCWIKMITVFYLAIISVLKY